MKTGLQAVALSLIGLVTFGLLLFWPAGTFNYWQAWVFIAVFTALTAIYTIYVGVQHPEVLRRRMRAGPAAETRPVQKIVAAGVYVMFAALLVVSALDHRFGWSPAPAAISVAGDVLVAIGLGITMLVVIQNTYAAATITVEAGQKVVSTGSVWAGTSPDVRRSAHHAGRDSPCARLLLGPWRHRPIPRDSCCPRPRRGKRAHQGIGWIQRILA